MHKSMTTRKVRSTSPAISEARLRRIIRDELSRQLLMQEGFTDFVKKPFQKLSDKAKEWVAQKSSELAKKAVEAVNSLKVPEDMRKFLTDLKSQEGGVDIDELTAMIPGLSEGMAQLESVKDLDLSSSVEDTKNESVSLDEAKLSYILAEEKYLQKLEGLRQRINESIVLAAVSAWYAFSKTVVTTLGLIIFLLEGGAKIAKLLGFKKAEHLLEKIAHFTEKIEKWFLAKAIFPAPVQYAAYLALQGAKKVAGKEGKVLSIKEFQAPENKEVKEQVLKGLKIALLCVIVVEALTHLMHALHEFFENIYHSAAKALHAGEHAGLEGRNIVKLGGELSKIGGETAKDIEALGGASGTVAARA
jgi:hypothetical protein